MDFDLSVYSIPFNAGQPDEVSLFYAMYNIPRSSDLKWIIRHIHTLLHFSSKAKQEKLKKKKVGSFEKYYKVLSSKYL